MPVWTGLMCVLINCHMLFFLYISVFTYLKWNYLSFNRLFLQHLSNIPSYYIFVIVNYYYPSIYWDHLNPISSTFILGTIFCAILLQHSIYPLLCHYYSDRFWYLFTWHCLHCLSHLFYRTAGNTFLLSVNWVTWFYVRSLCAMSTDMYPNKNPFFLCGMKNTLIHNKDPLTLLIHLLLFTVM